MSTPPPLGADAVLDPLVSDPAEDARGELVGEDRVADAVVEDSLAVAEVLASAEVVVLGELPVPDVQPLSSTAIPAAATSRADRFGTVPHPPEHQLHRRTVTSVCELPAARA